jgi:hypothetical protein
MRVETFGKSGGECQITAATPSTELHDVECTAAVGGFRRRLS